MKILLFVKDTQSAKETADKVKEFLKQIGAEVELFVNRRECEEKPSLEGVKLLIVVGGDGTFLAGARLVAKHSIPILGVNEGRFGFLTEVERHEMEEVIRHVLDGSLKPQKRMMLSAYLRRGDSESYMGDYLNDVVVSKESLARMVEIEISVQEEMVLRVYGDGAIVSSPTGSTAYALSAGGPIIYPLSEALLFVPICPHTLSNRPLLLPAHFEIKLTNLSPDHMAYLTLDGQEGMSLKKGDTVIVRKSENYCLMYANPKRSFFSILREKLRWG
ncbi:MAG: NAD(+)/NADH kinase [Aquificaceae bacterium]|nr:NAD(+)/NADH kinase [Aquificaceae bacterium]MDW8423803.1 NAD(+)/NADH kinase [Aquificaceae bacterium]